jgi:hypothetical protein
VFTANNAAPASGAFGSASSTGRYMQIGKTVFYKAELTLTTNGTGAGGAIHFTLPVQAANTIRQVNVGRSSLGGNTDLMAHISTALPTVVQVALAPSGGYPGADGLTITVSGTYESI